MYPTSIAVSLLPNSFESITIEGAHTALADRENAIAGPYGKLTAECKNGLSINISAPLQTYKGIPISTTPIFPYHEVIIPKTSLI